MLVVVTTTVALYAIISVDPNGDASLLRLPARSV